MLCRIHGRCSNGLLELQNCESGDYYLYRCVFDDNSDILYLIFIKTYDVAVYIHRLVVLIVKIALMSTLTRVFMENWQK